MPARLHTRPKERVNNRLCLLTDSRSAGIQRAGHLIGSLALGKVGGTDE